MWIRDGTGTRWSGSRLAVSRLLTERETASHLPDRGRTISTEWRHHLLAVGLLALACLGLAPGRAAEPPKELTAERRQQLQQRAQELTDQGWITLRHVHPGNNGRFSVAVPALRSTQLRLAYNSLVGDAVALRVAPRVSLQASGTKLHVMVAHHERRRIKEAIVLQIVPRNRHHVHRNLRQLLLLRDVKLQRQLRSTRFAFYFVRHRPHRLHVR